MLAVGLSIVLGYAGQVNLAQAAFFGMGAYATAVLTVKVGLGYWVAFPLSIVAAGLLGLVVGLPSLRVQSHYLGIVTLGLAISFSAVLVECQLHGPGGRAAGPARARHSAAWTSATSTTTTTSSSLPPRILFALAMLMMRTALGRRFQAMRDDALAAAHMGVEVPTYRMLAFVIAACYAGVAGALYAGLIRYVSPDTFSLAIMFLLLAMVIVGGRDNLYGAALGARAPASSASSSSTCRSTSRSAYGLLIVGMVVVGARGPRGARCGASGSACGKRSRARACHSGGSRRRLDEGGTGRPWRRIETSADGRTAGGRPHGNRRCQPPHDVPALEIHGVTQALQGTSGARRHHLVGAPRVRSTGSSARTARARPPSSTSRRASTDRRAARYGRFGERVQWARRVSRLRRGRGAHVSGTAALPIAHRARERHGGARSRCVRRRCGGTCWRPWSFRARERELRGGADELLRAFQAEPRRGLPRHQPPVRPAATGGDRAGDGDAAAGAPARRAGRRAQLGGDERSAAISSRAFATAASPSC